MRLTEAVSPAQLKAVRALYKSAFPANERKPFSTILRKRRKGQMELFCITGEDGGFYGLVITVLHRDLVLLDYFAVSPEKQGNGIGTQALALIRERYAGRRLVLEIEDPDVPCDNRTERVRRRSFYLKNGLAIMPFRVELFGTEMLLLTAGGSVTFAEYHEILETVFSAFIGRFVKQL